MSKAVSGSAAMAHPGAAFDQGPLILIQGHSWHRRACSLASASALIVLLAVALHLQSGHRLQHAPPSPHDATRAAQ